MLQLVPKVNQPEPRLQRDQGISRAGNPRARRIAIELAWLWLRYQPGSRLARWLHERVGTTRGRKALIEGLQGDYLLGDKAYDSDDFRKAIADQGRIAVIPSNCSRSVAIPYDKHLYKERHLVECFINKIKQFRRLATRYDKTAASFLSMLCLCAAMIWLR